MLPLGAGTNIQWFRWPMSYKSKVSGDVIPPMRPGFGQTALKIMQDGLRFYVGTGWVLDDGSERPYTVESDHYKDKEQAEIMFKKMTGKDIKKPYKEAIHRNLNYMEGSSDKFARIFDLRDTIISFLEGHGTFKEGKVPTVIVNRAEICAEKLINHYDNSRHLIIMAHELGFKSLI